MMTLQRKKGLEITCYMKLYKERTLTKTLDNTVVIIHLLLMRAFLRTLSRTLTLVSLIFLVLRA